MALSCLGNSADQAQGEQRRLHDRWNHGTYYTRRIIPSPLRPFMPEPWRGKSKWKRTLGTKDPKEAKRANIAMQARMQAAITAAEMRQKATTRESLTDEEIKALADWYGLEQLSQDTAFRETEYAEDEAVHAEVRAQLVSEGVPIPPMVVAPSYGMSDRLAVEPGSTVHVPPDCRGPICSVPTG